MRTLSGPRLAMTLASATALTTAASLTAYAHDDVQATQLTWEAPALDRRVPLNVEVYAHFLDAKLARLAAYADALRAKVAAIPADEVLTGLERRVARMRLAKAARLNALLAAIPDTGAYAPSAAQQATIAAIRADLAAVVARLRLLLANEPVVTPVTVRTPEKTVDLREAARLLWGRDCDGRHDGDWDGWRSWDGWRRWDRR